MLGATLALAACGAGGSDKAGGEHATAPTVLTLANGNGDARELEPFAGAVARLSGGTLRIAFRNRVSYGDSGFERLILADVKAGRAELGWVGTRALDDVGVASFDAFHAPLLIDSYALQRQVLESPLADAVLPGLEPLGVVGLGILPGPLRKPLGAGRLARPADFRGRTIAYQRSQVGEQTLRALGARAAAIASAGKIDDYDGVEQQVASIAGNRYDTTGRYLTANVNLWPRPIVLFANPRAFAALTAVQRSALRRAARAALPATIAAERADELEGSQNLCRRQVTFVTATTADLAALSRALGPVYDRLERDPQTKAAIRRIRALRSQLAAAPDAPVCSAATAPAGSSAKASPIDGVYRSDITLDELERTPGYDSGENHPGNIGHFRMRLGAGRFLITGSSDRVDQAGTFTLKGDRLRLDWNDEGTFTYRWSLYRGTLTLRKTGAGPTIFAVHPWRRVGDAPSVGQRTPLDGVYQMTSTARQVSAAAGVSPTDVDSENYGSWRFVLSRGLMRYTQASQGASRWTKATYIVKGHTLAFTITDYGGEAPNGAAEKTGEVLTFGWSLYRGRLTLTPVEGKISPENFSVNPWRRVGDAP